MWLAFTSSAAAKRSCGLRTAVRIQRLRIRVPSCERAGPPRARGPRDPPGRLLVLETSTLKQLTNFKIISPSGVMSREYVPREPKGRKGKPRAVRFMKPFQAPRDPLPRKGEEVNVASITTP